MKFNPFTGNITGLSEINQQNPVQFQVLRKDNKTEFTRMTPFFKCTDFMMDVMCASFMGTGKKVQIYGFNWDGKDPFFNQINYIMIKYPEKPIFKHLLFQEMLAKFDNLTKIIYGKDGEYVIEMPQEWSQHPLLTHAWFFLIRSELNMRKQSNFKEFSNLDEIQKTIDNLNYHDNDFPLFKQPNANVIGQITNLLKNRKKFCLSKDKTPDIFNEDLYKIHNNSGIKSFINKNPVLSKNLQLVFKALKET